MGGAAVGADHDVLFATGPNGLDIAAAAGITTVKAGLSTDQALAETHRRYGNPSSPVRGGVFSHGREGWRLATRSFAHIYAPAMIDDLLRAVESWRPNVIVYEPAAYAGAVLARRLGVSSAVHSYGVFRPLDALDGVDVIAEGLWERYGLAAPKWMGLQGTTYLDVCPPGLQSSHIARLPHVLKIRTVERPRAAPEAKRPMVYVTFGTVFPDREIFRIVLEGLRDLDADVIVTVGHHLDPADLGPQPDHVRVERFVPQDEILGRVAAVVCHAGSGSLLGALAAGVPVVMIPRGADQFWNAEACSRAGAGIVIADVSSETVARAVHLVLSETAYRGRAQVLADEIAAMPSPCECLAALERDMTL
jgi:hypothetical protein